MKEENLFIETTINEWRDIFKIDEKFIKQFLYRGQGNKDWLISSSIERLVSRLFPNFIDKDLLPSQESEMIKEFQWKSKLFNINGLKKEDYIEWLAIMQHYGACTRLIDFTDSFFVAAHMAIYESSTDASIWCINKNSLIINTFEHYKKNVQAVDTIGNDILNDYSLDVANDMIKNSFDIDEKGILLIRPKNINERLYRQQGIFLMSQNIKVPFMENLESLINNINPQNIDFDKFTQLSKKSGQRLIGLLKINVPRHIHTNIIRNLREMNINSELLFPGIEGLAKSLNYNDFNSVL